MKTVAEKIAKLLAKADSSKKNGEIEEAEIFAAHANRLMTINQITVEDIANIGGDREKPRFEEPIQETSIFNSLYKNKTEGTWESSLINTIARNNFCSALFLGNTSFHLIGTASNVECCLFLFDVIKEKFRAAANNTYSQLVVNTRNKYSKSCSSLLEASNWFNYTYPEFISTMNDFMPSDYSDSMKGKYQIYKLKNLKVVDIPERSVYIRSFLLGAVSGLNQKYKKEKEQFMADLQSENQAILNQITEEGNLGLVKTSKELVKLIQDIALKNESKIKDFMKVKHPNTTTTRGESAGDWGAHSAGTKFGQNIGINKGVSYSGTSTKQLN